MAAGKAAGTGLAERAAAAIAGAPGARKFPEARKASVRYSLFVNLMRFVLPAVALALIAVVAIWPQIHSGNVRFRLNFAKVSPESAASLSMAKPRFTGLDTSERPYTITAESAVQVADGSSLIDLDTPQADVTLKDGSWVSLNATEGTYDQGTADLDLRGEVGLFHDKGYEFRTDRAFMNLKGGTAHGEERVEGQGPFGHLTSEGFRISQHGKYIVFTGRAKLIINPKNARGKR
jgi:lipopolysaccharide export system protein LptC